MTMYYDLWHMSYVFMSMAELLQLHMSPVHYSGSGAMWQLLIHLKTTSYRNTNEKLAKE